MPTTKYHRKNIDDIIAYRHDKKTKKTYLTLKIVQSSRKVQKEVDTSNVKLIHWKTLNSELFIKFYRGVNGAKSFQEFEMKICNQGVPRHHCITIPVQLDGVFQHKVPINKQWVENKETEITQEEIVEACMQLKTCMFPPKLLQSIHRMDYQNSDGNQMYLPKKAIPHQFIIYENGSKKNKRNKSVLRPHKKGRVNLILLKSTSYCKSKGLLIQNNKKKSKSEVDDNINNQINMMTIPQMSMFEAKSHITSKSPSKLINDDDDDYFDDSIKSDNDDNIKSDNDDEQLKFNAEINKYMKDIRQNNASPQNSIQSQQNPTQQNNAYIQMPASLFQQILDQNNRVLNILQNVLPNHQNKCINSGVGQPIQFNNTGQSTIDKSSKLNDTGQSLIDKKPNNTSDTPPTNPYRKGLIKRKIIIYKLVLDKNAKKSVISRAKALEPPLIVTTGEVNDTKLFFKFCQQSNIVVDEEEHEDWTTKKFRKELIDGSKVAMRYQKEKNKKLTISRAIRWSEYVGSLAGWTPPESVVDFVEESEEETNDNEEMSLDEQ
eukprot:33912_1